MAVRLRRLRPADRAAYVALLRRSGLPPRVRGRDSPSAFAKQLRSNRTSYIGAFDGERLVGVVLGTHDTRKGWINRLAVHPEFRGRGIARRLVRACEKEFRAVGLEVFAALIEPGNEASEVFFRSLGYDVMRMQYARRKLRSEA